MTEEGRMSKARYEVRLRDTKGYTQIVTVWAEGETEAIERTKLWFAAEHDLGFVWAEEKAERIGFAADAGDLDVAESDVDVNHRSFSPDGEILSTKFRAEPEHLRRSTQLMRGSPHPTWRRLRERLRERGIDPFDAVVARGTAHEPYPDPVWLLVHGLGRTILAYSTAFDSFSEIDASRFWDRDLEVQVAVAILAETAKPVLGYAIHAADNDSFYYELAEHVPACPACGLVTEPDWLNPTFDLKRTDLDISYTWDAALIVSEKFVKFAGSYPGGRFLQLPSVPGFALFTVEPTVPFDAERRGTTFEDPCGACGRFTQIAGADPIYLKLGTVLPEGFSRTDVVFGSAHWNRPDRFIAQSPGFLVDSELGRTLAAQEFVGLRLEPIPSG